MAADSTDTAWWNRGNLHDKTLGDWLDAQEDNRLATSLDILIAMKEDLGAQVEYKTGDELLYRVAEMVGCMDALASQIPSPGEIAVSEAALTAAQALGYLGSESLAAPPPDETPQAPQTAPQTTSPASQDAPASQAASKEPKGKGRGKRRRKRKKK